MEPEKENSILRARIKHLELIIFLMHKALWNVKPHIEHFMNMKELIASHDHAGSVEIIDKLLKASKTRGEFENALLEAREDEDESVYVSGAWTPRWCLKAEALP